MRGDPRVVGTLLDVVVADKVMVCILVVEVLRLRVHYVLSVFSLPEHHANGIVRVLDLVHRVQQTQPLSTQFRVFPIHFQAQSNMTVAHQNECYIGSFESRFMHNLKGVETQLSSLG